MAKVLYDMQLETDLQRQMQTLATLLHYNGRPSQVRVAAREVKILAGRIERKLKDA